MALHLLKKSTFGCEHGCEVIVTQGHIAQLWHIYFWIALNHGYNRSFRIHEIAHAVVEKQPRIRGLGGTDTLASDGCEAIAARGEKRQT